MIKFILALAISLGWTQLIRAYDVTFYSHTSDILIKDQVSSSLRDAYLRAFFVNKHVDPRAPYGINILDTTEKHRPEYTQPLLQLIIHNSKIIGFAALKGKSSQHQAFLEKFKTFKKNNSSETLFKCTTERYQNREMQVCTKRDTPSDVNFRIYLQLSKHNKQSQTAPRGVFYEETFKAFAKTDLSKKDAMAYINKYFSVNTPVVRNSANEMAIFKSKEKHLTEINQPLAFLVMSDNLDMLGLASFETDNHDHRVFLNQFNSMRSTGVRLPILNCSTVNTGSTPIRICVQQGLSASKKTLIYTDLKKAYATNLSRLDAYR